MFMDKRTEQAFAYLEKNEHSMMELLKNLVSIETPSADREANERIAAHLDTYCDALGMERQIHHFEKAGPTFAAWTRPQEKKPILLLGHMDTVHAVGKFGPEPFLVKDDRVYGPGVYDMKGGDVIALFVLRALNAVGMRTDRSNWCSPVMRKSPMHFPTARPESLSSSMPAAVRRLLIWNRATPAAK